MRQPKSIKLIFADANKQNSFVLFGIISHQPSPVESALKFIVFVMRVRNALATFVISMWNRTRRIRKTGKTIWRTTHNFHFDGRPYAISHTSYVCNASPKTTKPINLPCEFAHTLPVYIDPIDRIAILCMHTFGEMAKERRRKKQNQLRPQIIDIYLAERLQTPIYEFFVSLSLSLSALSVSDFIQSIWKHEWKEINATISLLLRTTYHQFYFQTIDRNENLLLRLWR